METTLEAQTQPPLSRWTLGIIILAAYLYPVLLFGFGSSYFRGNDALAYVITIISGLIFGGLGLWGIRRDGIPVSGMWQGWKSVLSALVRVALIWALVAGLYLILAGKAAFDPVGDPRILFQQWIFTGIGEELLFRGYLYNRLKLSFQHLSGAWPMVAALLVANFIFATIHIPVRIFQGTLGVDMLISMVATMLLGIFFTYLMLRTKNILFSGLVHGGWNAPLLGSKGDFIVLVFVIVVVEVWHRLNGRRGRKQPSNLQT